MNTNSDLNVGGAIRDLPSTGMGDKIDHALAGALAFAVFCLGAYILARLAGITSPLLIASAGLLATASVALFLEIAQKYTRSGVFDWWDFAATVAPALLVTVMIYLLR